MMCELKDFSHLKLAPPYRTMLEQELEDWHKTYIPKDGLEGKNVLDLGAGCGETVQFFLNHGAKSVHPVESEDYAYKLLQENFSNDTRVVWDGLFKIDFIKCDCEGGEKEMVIETHFPVYIRPLPFSKISCPNSNLWRIEGYDKPNHYGRIFRIWLFLYQFHHQIRHYMSKLP